MTTTEERKTRDNLATEITGTLMYLQLATMAIGQLRERCHAPFKPVANFAKELLPVLAKTERKINWFVGVTEQVLGPADGKLLEQRIDISGDKFNNIAQLASWIIETPADLCNEVDLVTSKARRHELMLRSWKVALGRELSPEDEMRFNAWYNANFPHH